MNRKQQLTQLFQNMPKDKQGKVSKQDLVKLILFLVDGEDNNTNPQNNTTTQPEHDNPDDNEEWHTWINSDSE